ncbi:hypothetical protein, partial [Providencia burhodogranariea]|uniref:hypothetical protein n=1 Tax=Providencia burhodogranariea TaxID=516074 RepID=UPI001F3BF1E3
PFRSVSRGVAYYANLVESQAFFSLIFSDSLTDYVVPVSLSPRSALTHRGSVDAHYRELRKSRKYFFEKKHCLKIKAA